jgi:hypothetical protein
MTAWWEHTSPRTWRADDGPLLAIVTGDYRAGFTARVEVHAPGADRSGFDLAELTPVRTVRTSATFPTVSAAKAWCAATIRDQKESPTFG